MAKKSFDETLAAEQAAGRKARLEDAPPLGALPDGSIAAYKPDDVPMDDLTVVYGDTDDRDEGEFEDGEDLGDA